jgi:hypothetical protein
MRVSVGKKQELMYCGAWYGCAKKKQPANGELEFSADVVRCSKTREGQRRIATATRLSKSGLKFGQATENLFPNTELQADGHGTGIPERDS